MNAMPKHVAISTLSELEWNATPLSGDVPSAVAGIKDGDGGPILVAGSATLVRMLLAERLVDELRLLVYPVMIGGGLGIFPQEHGKGDLALEDLVRYDSGVVLRVYRPAS